ncbi:MAG: transporter substrate-binding domain-containing protein [Ruminococcus sp.]|jgi:polar amino acid transport system substrate-binding protein|nr:transporter substrate-binding domain-containing protein [Ruminococcus sp.]
MKKFFSLICVAVLILSLFLTSCGTAASGGSEVSSSENIGQVSDPNDPNAWQNYIGKTFAIKMGSVFEPMIKNDFEASDILYFTDNTGCFEAVRIGKIDVTAFDTSAAAVFLEDYPELLGVKVPSEIFSMPMGYPTENPEIRDEFNTFLAEITADGTLEEIQNRWLSGETLPDLDAPMPEIDLSDTSRGKVTVAITGANVPFDYMGADGEYKGYDIELTKRYAAWAKREIEYAAMDFGSIINYVASGKADLGASGISITEERKKSVGYTEPVYFDTCTMLVRRSDFEGTASAAETVTENVGFIEEIKTSVQRNLIDDNRYKLIISGLLTTMLISVVSMIIGTALGSGVAYLLTRKNKIAARASRLVCGLVSGLPTVTLLMVSYYIIFGKVDINSVYIAIATFSLVMAIRIGETLTDAINTVNPVEIKAARASGFTATGAFMTVTLPQAVKTALGPYLSHFVTLVKETAIVGYVAIGDLMRASDIIRSRTYDPYFPLIFAALIYLVITTVFILIFKAIVKKVTHKI